jgi:tetratricopeptide (TPR) repeat protein
MPDNRAEVDTAEKVRKLLVSAYPENSFTYYGELASDNVDDMGSSVTYHHRIWEQMYKWEEVTETSNEDPQRIWEASYGAITNANQALSSLEEIGANTSELRALRGEALLCRAYNHFVLVNMFCKGYNPKTAESDLGIPYMEKAETELNPKYERGTVANVYKNIAKDLEEGLPLVNDAIYTIPKYHFNEKAAYTFASRFYLFSGEWDKAIECATKALGSSPRELLRDYDALAALPRDEDWTQAIAYTSTDVKANFLLTTAYSGMGAFYSGKIYGDTEVRIATSNMLAQTEVFNLAPWGAYAASNDNYTYARMYKVRPYTYKGDNFDKTHMPKVPMLFEYTDPVAGIGYFRSNFAVLTAEEALLNRAEAYIMKEQYDLALADLNLWTANILNPSYCTAGVTLTLESIKNWANSMNYYTSEVPTPKKHINHLLATITEGSDQEAMLQCAVYMRRIELLQTGLRWWDIKRLGIEIYRRTLKDLSVASVDDCLTLDDERRALQLPKDVITSGLTANPR